MWGEVVELKYRETERQKESERSRMAERKEAVLASGQRVEWEQEWASREKHWHSKQATWQAQEQELRSANHALVQQLNAAQDNHQRALQEAISLKQKERTASSRVTITEKSL